MLLHGQWAGCVLTVDASDDDLFQIPRPTKVSSKFLLLLMKFQFVCIYLHNSVFMYTYILLLLMYIHTKFNCRQ